MELWCFLVPGPQLCDHTILLKFDFTGSFQGGQVGVSVLSLRLVSEDASVGWEGRWYPVPLRTFRM